MKDIGAKAMSIRRKLWDAWINSFPLDLDLQQSTLFWLYSYGSAINSSLILSTSQFDCHGFSFPCLMSGVKSE